MEDVYTIKVKTKPDTRNLYPSERRYSASTVSGLAWVHIALASTSFLLACLALVNPNTEHMKRLKLNDTDQKFVDKHEFLYNLSLETTTEWTSDENVTENTVNYSNDQTNSILVIAPSLLTIFALGAGLASMMASVRWYIDRNITWLFIMSILSSICSLVAFIMIASWFINTSDGKDNVNEFYRDKIPFKDFFVVKHSDVISKNESHLLIAREKEEDATHLFTKHVLSINILIAAFLEFLWSILSVKISYKGMRSSYKEDDSDRRGNCITVVTTIKGNNAKKYPRNGKLLPPKSDLIPHYPSKNIKKIFLANGDNGFYLKNQTENDKCTKQNTETSSELYKERMMNYLNRCSSLEAVSNPDITPSVHSESVLNTIPEVTTIEINKQQNITDNTDLPKDNMTPISWGDTPEHTIYNQNNIDLDKLFKFAAKMEKDGGLVKESEKQTGDEISEIVQNN